jgi:hypothetical protein
VDAARVERSLKVSRSFLRAGIGILSARVYNCGSDGNGGYIVVRPNKLIRVFEGIDDEATNHPMG